MGREPKYSKQEKIEISERYHKGESAVELAFEYKCNRSMIYEWYKKYIAIGDAAFYETRRERTYSKELKLSAIKDYQEGKGSLENITNKYKISKYTLLKSWIIKYNSHIEITDHNPKPEVYMAKSRKTTYEERIEITRYCLENKKNYKDTAFKYGVNYAQVYKWVKKYKEQGEEGLLDHRGRNKLESEMTEEEKLKHQLKRLEAKNAYLEMENKALKKLEEIERRTIKGKSR